MYFAQLSLFLTGLLFDPAAAYRKKLKAEPANGLQINEATGNVTISSKNEFSDKEFTINIMSEFSDIAPLLGKCPRNANDEDKDGAWCDYKQNIQCCSNACRYKTSASFFGSENTVVPDETVKKLFAAGKHPSAACCGETVTLEIDGSWTCRNAPLPIKDLLDQIARGPMEHRWHMFASALMQMYESGVAELEQQFSSEYFYYKAPLSVGEALAKPMVMTLGGYSTGKTTFIKNIIGKGYRGMHIGNEPTTDSYNIIQYGENEQITPGQILAVDGQQQFEGASQFGAGFLSSFQGVRVNSPILQNFSILDTPGVLSGEKQFKRNYDFLKVSRWFADHADLILLMFDVNKIDISDELRKLIETLGPNQHKVRIVLNKADSLNLQDLFRSYGGLMYGLGRVFDTPELKRIYVGSFREDEYNPISESMHSIFREDQGVLASDLKSLKTDALMEKLNKFINRVKLAKAHATLLDELRKRMPWFGKDKKKKELIGSLADIYEQIVGINGLAIGELPDVKYMQEKLEDFDFSTIPTLKSTYIHDANTVLDGMSSLMAATKRAWS